ncbi:TIGR02300 family protein [Tistrella bauzanensis]|nr:TIGR02300 family protein [Tistrella bauzanensis]
MTGATMPEASEWPLAVLTQPVQPYPVYSFLDTSNNIEGGRVAKEEWGQKHTCRNCGARFYDMRRTPVTCPKCGTEQPQIEEPRSRRQAAREADELARERAALARKAKVVPAVVEEAEEDGFDPAFTEEDDDDEDVGIEDPSELGDDDVSDVHIGGDDDDT